MRIPYRLPHSYRLTAPALSAKFNFFEPGGTGRDWTAQEGTGQDWTGLNGTGPSGTGLDGIGLDGTGLEFLTAYIPYRTDCPYRKDLITISELS